MSRTFYNPLPLLALALLCPLAAQPLLVAAAADLAPLEDPISAAFQAKTGIRVQFSFGSSGMLARQISHGAPYDVYLSANQQFVDDLRRSGAILSSSVTSYATGRLGLWSANGKVNSLNGLKGARAVAIANPKHAPYGVAAKQALEASGVYAGLRSRLVLSENVRQAFEFARTGNVDAVLTSWTLLHGRGGILIPEELHRPIRQGGAVVKGTKREGDARKFLSFLVSPEGQAILAAGGLFPPQ